MSLSPAVPFETTDQSQPVAAAEYARLLATRARQASRVLAQLRGDLKQAWLVRCAERIWDCRDEILSANARDIAAAPGYGLSAAAIDRLRLTDSRLKDLSAAVLAVHALTDPIGEVLDSSMRPNGLSVSRVRVPLGVVFFIYESRPNVTVDAAALCVKSGNAVILRGGKEALHSNRALAAIVQQSLVEVGLPEFAVQLVETTDRAIVGELLKLHELIDVAIPRGGKSLITRVANEATMPVIKHFDGICHVYVDRRASIPMAVEIVRNSKIQRPGVCNAAECLLVHQDIAADFLPAVARMFRDEQVEVRGCATTLQSIPEARLATADDYRTEYLAKIISCRVVADLPAAVEHIQSFGSHHTEAIVTDDLAAAQEFVAAVDSAAVMVNASTRFNDGGELGLGAEIGISTDKFHARGPCGLRELTSYKYVVIGQGQVRG